MSDKKRKLFGGHRTRQEQLDAMEDEAMGRPKRKDPHALEKSEVSRRK